MADYYTQTSFAVHVDAREADILPEIDEVIDLIRDGFETTGEAIAAWQACSERFRALFPADDTEAPFARFTALFNDETYPCHGAEFITEPDPGRGDGIILYVSGDGVDPFALARLLQKTLPSALPFRFGWAETCSRMRVDDFGGGFIEVTAERLIPLIGLGQDIDRQHLVVVVRDDACGLLFWSNESGFGPLKSATVSTQREADTFRLPSFEDAKPGWLELPPVAAWLGEAA